MKKVAKIVLQVILWATGIFFILGGITTYKQSGAEAILMLIDGVIALPPTWRVIRSIKPKVMGRPLRGVLFFGLFFAAMAAAPQSQNTSSQSVNNSAAAAAPVKSDKPITINKAVQIRSIDKISDTAVIKGTGDANTVYKIDISSAETQEVKTNDNGDYIFTIPTNASKFGTVSVWRDTNGGLPGGKETYQSGYYSIADSKPVYSTQSIEPELVSVNGSSDLTISGYYTPDSSIELRSGDSVLGAAKVDKSGAFKVTKVKVKKNYLPVTVFKKESTGWFSSKTSKVSTVKYLDTTTRKALSQLPSIVKEVAVNTNIPFESQTLQSSSLPKGQTQITQNGVNGQKTAYYSVTYKGDTEISRTLLREAISKVPITKITTTGTYVAPAPSPTPAPAQPSAPSTPSNSHCDPNYSGCVPIDSDVDCAGGSGDGPSYLSGTARVIGTDIYKLDRDKDGIACN